ncbi:hypothetical protein [Raoultella ornithinolytica]|uniref:hypothetical protein n=1 Tax=Raoultella ornithinolytica TaxID=54291 RepID=UPI00024FC02A|nr:hypothetical protein [Raoultella ornithinolytica]EHT08330.1 hypothetical protein HMPREF9690_03060 [Raoultella ornithinolytica 10-5246]HCB1275754.1 hypothetical protein [Klebsiella pneumoniae]
MTTDITELAQREKFEAWFEGAEALPWGYLKNRRTSDSAYQDPDITDMWVAWKAAGAELVEALEKAQLYIKELRDWNAGLAQESFERQQRIAELESRSVTVKLPQAVSAGGQGYQGQVERILTAAGIKVEAE